jgi:hypothetical protein
MKLALVKKVVFWWRQGRLLVLWNGCGGIAGDAVGGWG